MNISYKVAFFFALFLASAIAYNSQWGKRDKKDAMIFSTRVYNNSIRGAYIQRDLTFPQVITSKSKTITFIDALDNFRNSSGGYATLIAGGPKFKYVTLRFTSQYNYGLDFNVYIWAK
ncbi:hypothetical protein ACFFRR_007504 [Megaselia abdita]